MDIHVLEAWTQNSHGAKSHEGLILDARTFHSGSKSLHLGQMLGPRLLEHEKKSLASKMSPP